MKTFTAKKLFNFTGSADAEVRATLGEGPTWNANNIGGHRRTLSWTDIKQGKLFLWDTISNRINVIHVVHLEEDQLHYALNMGGNLLGASGASSGSGSSATANGMAEACLVEGKPTIAGEVEMLGFAVPVADSEVFLCGSQHGLFYLRTNHISALSVSSHDDKNATTTLGGPFPSSASAQQFPINQFDVEAAAAISPNPNANAKVLMDTTALQFSAAAGMQSAATIRFYTFYISMEQYLYTLPPVLANKLPSFGPFTGLKIAATELSSVAAASHSHRIRFNDAKTDRTGRLFLGTMDMEEREAIGDLYVLDPEAHIHGHSHGPIASGAHDPHHAPVPGNAAHVHTSFRSLARALAGSPPTISNGIDWSPCNTRMFYADSPTRRVDCFDYRVFADHSKCASSSLPNKSVVNTSTAAGSNLSIASVSAHAGPCEDNFSFVLKNRKPFFDLKANNVRGYPDGLTVDANGTVWVALWDGGRVIGINPTTQCIVAEVVVPNVSNVTSVCFGGPALSWLIITTAAKEGEPDSGHVFVADYLGGAVGLPATEFKGTAFSPPSISAFPAPTSADPVVIGHRNKKDGKSSSATASSEEESDVDHQKRVIFQSKL